MVVCHGLPKEGRRWVARPHTGLLHREALEHHVQTKHDSPLHGCRAPNKIGRGAAATAPGSHKTDRTKPSTSRQGRGPRPPLPLWLFLIGLVGMQWQPVQATTTVPTASVVGSKRAIRRAAGRAQAHGGTWYKGKWLTAKNLGHINTMCTQRTSTGSQRRGRRGGAKESARLRLLSLNVGSLSTLLWQELKEFLLTAPHDIICLQETHWSTK